jgi:hypothetical protein
VSGGKAGCHFVSTRPGAASFEQDARIVSPAGGSINPRKNHIHGTVTKGANDERRHPCFLLLSFLTYNVLRDNNTVLQGYNNAITIHFVTNTHFTNLLAPCRSGVPRTLPGGSSEVNRFKSSRQPVARRGVMISQPHRTINLR